MKEFDWDFGWILEAPLRNYRLGLVREALSALQEGVKRCSEQIESARASGCEDHADLVTDEACDVVETLLGSAFMVCQTHIAQVVSEVIELHKTALKPRNGNPGATLRTTTTKKADIMRHGCPVVGATDVTVIEALNALANYFKHRDEWPTNWNSAKPLTSETIRVINAIGVSQFSTGNLRTGSEALGNTDYQSMNVFANLLENWHDELMAGYESELKAVGLLKISHGVDK